MDPPPARRAASKRRDRRRRLRKRQREAAAAAAATATRVGAAVEPQSAAVTTPVAPAAAGAAATPAARGRNRRRRSRRRRHRGARAAGAAGEAPAASPVPPDAISTQEDSVPQAGFNLDAMAAHLSDNVLQTTTKKITSSDKTRKRNFQAGNKALEDSAADGAACFSLAHREHSIRQNEASRSKIFKRSDVRFPIHSCTAQGTDDTNMDYHKMKSCDLPGNLEEVNQKRTCPGYRSLQKSEEYRENENESSLNSGCLQEGKKRRKRRGGKRHNRSKKATSHNSLEPTAADNSGLMTFLSENCNSGLKPEEQGKKQDQNKAPMTNLVLVNNAKRSEKLNLVFSPGKSLGFLKKKLLILDLNGLLADINEDYHNAHMADAKVRRKLVFRRPYCDDFLNFCALNFELGIWSSRKKENVASVVNIVMGEFKPRLLFCWDLSKCTFTGHKTLENKHKPLVLKELRKLWNMEEPDLPWEEGDYSPSNTLLVDDSPYKALRNPPYTAIFPRSYSYLNWDDNSLGPGGDLRVYLQNLAAADDVERFVRNNPFGQPFITERDPHWNFYSQIADRGCAPLTCCA